MVIGSVTVSSWAEAMKRIKKIKSLSKKMKLKISDVNVEQTAGGSVYNKGKLIAKEQFKLTWSYTL